MSLETHARAATSSHGISYLDTGPDHARLCLICVHGWACQASDYRLLFDALLAKHSGLRAIAVDLPGHGLSSTTRYPDGSLDGMVDAVLNLVSELKIDNIILVGHSMGMRVSLECWRKATARGKPTVKGLVFLDGSDYKLRKSLFAFDPGDARSKNLSREEKVAGMQSAFKRMFSDHTPADFQASTLAHVGAIDLKHSDKMRKSFIDFDYHEMDDALEKVGNAGVPLLSLQATDVDDQNQRIPLKDGERSLWMESLKAKVPLAQIVVVENSLHFPHVDQPSDVARRICDFIEALDT